MSNLQVTAIDVIDNALKNPNYAKDLLANPAEVFRRDGEVEIPEADDENFRSYFFKIASSEVLEGLTARSRSVDLLPQSVEISSRAIGCTGCKAATYTLAGALLAIGVAGLATLTTGSAVVAKLVQLGGIFGKTIATDAALVFLRGMAAVLSLTLGTIAGEICRYIGKC